MKKFYVIALCSAALSASAAHISPQQALSRLNNDGARRLAPQALRLQLFDQNVYPELYIFASGNGDGFVVLPADDSAAPLLGYSTSGLPDLSNPNLAYWLEFYSNELKHVDSGEYRPVMRSSRTPVSPLLQTKWNQSDPYNNLCPSINGTHCPTGCVATALAQALKFHNYPTTGTGSHSYTWNNQTLSFDFASTTFDWANMTDTYTDSSTQAQITAVATLMYACGIGVDMSYGASESGAVSRSMGSALLDYFGYDKGILYLERDYYGLNEWEELIYAELSAGRPVLYGGQGSAGGHQFVCDGYSADGYFHFNWGWGGLSDGYFLLTALNPPALGVGGGAGGFNYGQDILVGVQPPSTDNTEAYIFYCSGLTAGTSSTTLGSSVAFGSGFYNYSYFTAAAGTRLGLKFEPSDGSTPTFIYATYNAIAPYYGVRQLTLTIPTSLAEGTYKVTPVYKIPDLDWEYMRSPLSENTCLTATVSGSTISFAATDAAKLSLTDLTLETALYWGCDCKIAFTIENTGESEFYGGVIPVLISSDGSTVVAQGATYPMDIMPGTSEQAEYIGTFSAVTSSSSASVAYAYSSSSAPEAGTYLLGICNSSGYLLGNTVQVTLNGTPSSTSISITDFKLTSDQPLDGNTPAVFSVTAECTQGYFASTLTVAVFKTSGGSSLSTGQTDMMYISKGESASSQVNVDISSLDSGSYMAAVFNGSSQISSLVYFTVDSSTSISNLRADHGKYSADSFDLLGRPIPAERHFRGLFIQNGQLQYSR